MIKKLESIHKELEYSMLIEFAMMCILSLLSVATSNNNIVTFFLSFVILLLMATTATCFVTGMILLVHNLNEQVNIYLKYYEEHFKKNL